MTQATGRTVRTRPGPRARAALLAMALGLGGALAGAVGGSVAQAVDPQPGSISGTVHASRLTDLKASLYLTAGNAGNVTHAPIQTVPVAPDGKYTFTGVVSTDTPVRTPIYHVLVEDSRGELAATWAPDVRAASALVRFGDAPDVKVPSGTAVTGVDVTVGPMVTVSGTVRDLDGAPVAGTRVEVRPEYTAEAVATAVTGADGTYRTGQIPEMTVQVYAEADGLQPAFAGSPRILDAISYPPTDTDLTGVDITVGPYGAVKGRFTLPAGASRTGITVKLLDVQPSEVPGRVVFNEVESQPLSADGRYHFDDLAVPLLAYVVEIEIPDRRLYPKAWTEGNKWGFVPSPSLRPGLGETIDLGTVALVPTGALRGRLVSSHAGVPLTGVTITLTVVSCGNRCTHDVMGTAVVGADGTFRFAGLPGGTATNAPSYMLRVTDPKGRFEEGYVMGFVDPGPKVTDGATADVGSLTVKALNPPPPLKNLQRLVAPEVSGKAKVGKTLKASAGTWKPSKVTVKYQWQSRKVTKKGVKVVAVPQGKASKLKLTRTLKGRKVRVKVTVSAPGHRTVTSTTGWTKKVA